MIKSIEMKDEACGYHKQGYQIGFFEANFQNFGFFLNLVGVTKLIWLFAFFLASLHAEIICTKITYHPFSKSFSIKKNVFWSVIFGNISADKSLGKKAPVAKR
jgi:hypothetical protein